MRHRPGFVSANIHASTDGTRLVNYAQWSSAESFQSMLADPECREHMSAAALGISPGRPRDELSRETRS